MMARILLGCVALCALAFASLAEEPKETKLKQVTVFNGSHSKILKERFELVTTKEAWEKLWEEHQGKRDKRIDGLDEQRIDVDFETHYVVAIFSGWCGWCAITPRQRDNAVVIGFEPSGWQTEGRPPGKKPDKEMKKLIRQRKVWEDALAPYAFVILPKPVKMVIIEEGKRPDLMSPPVWKERTRFPAPKDKK